MKRSEVNTRSKRLQVEKNRSFTLAIVSIAAFVFVGSIMGSRSLYVELGYLSKVGDRKEEAVDQLEKNITAVATLQESYDTFKNQSPNLLGGSTDGTGDKDGDNAKLVLDALPDSYNFPALTSSVERLLEGYQINSIAGSDDVLSQGSVNPSIGAVEMPFNVDVKGSYADTRALLDKFRRSIRPISITKLELRGTDQDIQMTMSAKTYYQPQRGLEINDEVVE